MFSIHPTLQILIHSELRSPIRLYGRRVVRSPAVRLKAALRSDVAAVGKCTDEEKPSICTADELHYVHVPSSDWELALWRYKPPPNVPPRNHPLLLLSGVATNAIGFDLSPEFSFAQHMCSQGYDTWILEYRGAGLTRRRPRKLDSGDNSRTDGSISFVKGKRTDMVIKSDGSQLPTNLSDTITGLSEKLYNYFDEGLLEARRNTDRQIRDLSERLVNIVKGQPFVSTQYFNLSEQLSANMAKIMKLQKQLDLTRKYDWDFDSHLEEDLPTAMEYIRTECKPKDGKLLAIGHSMGGILLYAKLSRDGFDKKDSGLASIVTLGSSLDFGSSNSSLKLLLPMANPSQALSVPAVPVGPMLVAAHPFTSRLPYVLSWLNPQISAQDMMPPELYDKLVLNNFETVPLKLLAQLTTTFRVGGLRDSSGTFCYKDHLRLSNIPVLALAGDQDIICSPGAAYDTIKHFPDNVITYKVFGEPNGPHFAHYDLVGSRAAPKQVYPCIIEFLNHHDSVYNVALSIFTKKNH